MNRSSLRSTSLLVVALCSAAGMGCYYQSTKKLVEIDGLNSEKYQRQEELNNINRLSSQLDELDSLTLDERVATQLDILRHLGLSQMDLTFQIDARETQQASGVNLFIRGMRIENTMTYSSALKLIDMLQANRKMMIKNVEFFPGDPTKVDSVRVSLSGKIFGLEKKGNL